MDSYEQSDKLPPYPELRKAAYEFTIALEYDSLIAKEYLGIQRALNKVIINRLEGLSESELKVFYDAVSETAQTMQLTEEDCRLWRALEDHFGPYEIISRLAR